MIFYIKDCKPGKPTPHKEECCRRWHHAEKSVEHKDSRKNSPGLQNQEIEFAMQSMNKNLIEKDEKLRLLEQSNDELAKKLFEYEV